jgi:predicted AlkP superfamily phosphohydrolase/phosphomutase
MIGFDSAELSYIQANLASLPNFRRALNRGILTPLESPADLMAGCVWPTFNSGRPPGEHGIYHLMQWDAATMRLRRPSDQWLNYEPFWRKLEARGFNIIALDVPFTFPPPECRGVEITSWGAHDQLAPFSVHPQDLKRELRRRFGEHPMGIEVPVDKPLSERLRIARALVAGAATKGEMMRWLLTSRVWDFFIGVFGEAHRGGHILWPDPESRLPPSVLLDVYRALDNALGEILAVLEIQKATTVIFSLHGMGPNHSQEHFVAPLMTQVNARYSEMESPLFPPGFAPRQRSVMRLLREKIPPGIQSAIAKLVPQQVRDAVVDRSFTSGHDWSLTPGIALQADNNGYLRFNLVGRERQGMLHSRSGSLERYSELIHESFASLRTADGARLVKEIRWAADAFPGERTSRLPDLIAVWNGMDPACRAEGKLGTLLARLDTGRGGNHRSRGFQVILRPHKDRAERERVRPIVEVAPQILSSFTENSSAYA